MDLGMGEILMILLVALLVYGGRLPEVARSVGRAVATVKRNLAESTAEVTSAIDVRGDLDAAAAGDDDRPRTVRRAPAPAPADLATEDVSGTAPAPAAPVSPATSTDADRP